MTDILLANRFFRLTVSRDGQPGRSWSHPPPVQSQAEEGLEITFRITKTITREPNTGQISIYNLSADSRSYCQVKGAELTLEAGYEDLHGQIFTGQTQLVYSKREGTSWVTTLETGDGLKFLFGHGIGLALGGRVTMRQAVEESLAAMGVPKGVHKGLDALVDKTFPRGFVASGNPTTTMDGLADRGGLHWSIQDGRSHVYPRGQYGSDEIILISDVRKAGGLVGSPERFDRTLTNPFQTQDPFANPLRGIRFKSLLNPLIVPGTRVRLESRDITGTYRCIKVTQTGDRRGQPWYSEVEADEVRQ